MKDLAKEIAVALVDYPDEVRVVETKGTQCAVIELHVAKADIGKVIGRQGRPVDRLLTEPWPKYIIGHAFTSTLFSALPTTL